MLSNTNQSEPIEVANVKESESAEFTYTSFLGQVRPGFLDEQTTDESAQDHLRFSPLPEVHKAIEVESETINVESSITEEPNEAPVTTHDVIEETTNEPPLKSLSFDSIIEKVKLNKVSNKEVSNYVLNTLVGGEFDLEKNFVIQNYKSILLMIQVIKCANPSLKVNTVDIKNEL